MSYHCSRVLAIVFTGLMVSSSRADLIQGLRNYWNFDNNLIDAAHSISGSASQTSDNGIFDGSNGTGGIGFGTGLFGGAGIVQDGASGAAENNGFVRVPRSVDTLYGGKSLTTSLWVRTTGVDTGWQAILAHGEGAQYRIARRAVSDPPIASYAGGSGDIPSTEIGPPIGTDNGWHHILAISEHGVSTRLWVDGSLVVTGTAPSINDSGNFGSPGGSTPDLYIGANPQTGPQNREWWGEIDDVAQWDRVLAPSEIDEIYSEGATGNSLGALIAIPEPSSASLLILVLGLVTGAKYLVARKTSD